MTSADDGFQFGRSFLENYVQAVESKNLKKCFAMNSMLKVHIEFPLLLHSDRVAKEVRQKSAWRSREVSNLSH